jgi:hypothetical protein
MDVAAHAEIRAMFDQIRTDVHTECETTRELFHQRIQRMSTLLESEYTKLLNRASPELRAEVTAYRPKQAPAPLSRIQTEVRAPETNSEVGVLFGFDLLSSGESEMDDYL